MSLQRSLQNGRNVDALDQTTRFSQVGQATVVGVFTSDTTNLFDVIVELTTAAGERKGDGVLIRRTFCRVRLHEANIVALSMPAN